MSEPAAPSDSKGTILRVVDVLRCFAEGADEISLSEIAECVELPRSTTHRLLALLRTAGLVDAGTSHRYRAGTELFRIAALLSARMPLVQLGLPILRSVVEECDETALLGVYQHASRQMIFVAKVDSSKPIRYVIDLNVPRTLVWGATGRAILAFLDDDEIAAIVASNVEPSATGSLHIDKRKVKAAVDQIRIDGYAVSEGQRIANSIGIAAPFFLANGKVGGDIALTIPQYRYNARQQGRLVKLVMNGAAKMSSLLGYTGAPAAVAMKRSVRS